MLIDTHKLSNAYRRLLPSQAQRAAWLKDHNAKKVAEAAASFDSMLHDLWLERLQLAAEVKAASVKHLVVYEELILLKVRPPRLSLSCSPSRRILLCGVGISLWC